jgi:hypothetical protein
VFPFCLETSPDDARQRQNNSDTLCLDNDRDLVDGEMDSRE